MSVEYDNNYSEESCLKSNLSVNPSNPLYHPFNFLAIEYGNDIEKVLKRINTLIGSGLLYKLIKNNKLKSVIKMCQLIVTFGLVGLEFIMKIKNYITENKNIKSDPYKKRMIKASKLLNINENDCMYANIPHESYKLSSEIAVWFIQHPKTEKTTICGYYNMNTLEEIVNTIEFEPSKVLEIAIIFEINAEKFMWDLTFKTTVFEKIVVIRSFFLGKTLDLDKVLQVKNAIMYDFTKCLDIKNNIIKFDRLDSLNAVPRLSIKEQICQFDIARIESEIRSVLKNKRKRAFAFVGKQGVGKSSILRVIEMDMTDYMFIHLTPEDFEYPNRLKDRFIVCKLFQPVIIIIEDLDACGLKNKNRLTGAFLDCIDEINKDLNMIILVTINDTSLIHRTIINRPGRFDRVFEILPPQTIDEVIKVISSKIFAIKDSYCKGESFIDFDLNRLKPILERCVKEQFTQAELTNAITEQTLIDISIEMNEGKLQKRTWNSLSCDEFSQYLSTAIDKHISTKTAIKNCSFHGVDPEDDYNNIASEEAPTFMPTYGDLDNFNKKE